MAPLTERASGYCAEPVIDRLPDKSRFAVLAVMVSLPVATLTKLPTETEPPMEASPVSTDRDCAIVAEDPDLEEKEVQESCEHVKTLLLLREKVEQVVAAASNVAV